MIDPSKDKIDLILDKINNLEIRITKIEEKLTFQSVASKIYNTIITILLAGIGFLVGFIIK